MKKLLSIVMFALMILAVVGCSSTDTTSEESTDSGSETTTDSGSSTDSGTETTKPENYTITFPTGTTTGTYYPLGAILSDFWNKKLDYVKTSSQASNGSVQNLMFIKQGEAQVTLTPIGTLYEAVNGMASFEGNKVENVRILAGLYPNVNHLVARKGSGVESIEDIAGKKMVPGATGSATEIESQRTLAVHGVDYEALKKDFVGFTEATDLMRNKQTDAAMVMAGVPTSAVTEMLSTANGVLLSYSDEAIAALKEEYPTTSEYTIPANSYENQPEDVKTVAQFNFLVAAAEMPDEVAYDLVKTFWENIEELMGSHAVIEQFKVEAATSGTADVPLHPGAEKYYKEAGVLK
jgi:TRAP transporter TAXI family solute receptor